MNRNDALATAYEIMGDNDLHDWKVVLQEHHEGWGGRCNVDAKMIYLSGEIIDINPEPVILNIIKHEVAHALCPERGHGELWRDIHLSLGGDGKSATDMETPYTAMARLCPSYGAVYGCYPRQPYWHCLRCNGDTRLVPTDKVRPFMDESKGIPLWMIPESA